MAWDDLDPDGAGEPGDMRYDYELSRQRREHEREIRRRMAEQAALLPPVSTCLAHLQPEPCGTCDAYIAAGL